ncbi:MAG: hypothetical protein J6V57_04825 [Spirochaetaceae bacterium]|nr:hypothetical protein [Spirochaetaceae bacterium]
MGKLNLLKAAYYGKVGETVGAKWKDKNTVRVLTIPSNPNTQAQQTVRTVFRDMSKFVSLFSDQIKTVSALNTRGMSVRNAIIKMNKQQIMDGTFEAGDLVISRGGLPTPGGAAASGSQANGELTIPLVEITGSNVTQKAKIVIVAVSTKVQQAWVKVVDNTTASETISTGVTGTDPFNVYIYAIDYRGSAKVGSLSRHQEVIPA